MKNKRDMEVKEKGRKEAVETIVVHSGLFDRKKYEKIVIMGGSPGNVSENPVT